MKQKVEELLIELSMLNDDLQETKRLIIDKKKELKYYCDHDKIQKRVLRDKSNGNIKFIIYKCLICNYEKTSVEEDQELEKKVNK